MSGTYLPGKGRIEALTDGIFAVAMTLLVLDLRLPTEAAELDASGLRAALSALLPRLEAYVVSFGVLCLFWLGHHRLMHRLSHVDRMFLSLNLLFIMFITLIPFSTSLTGAYRDLDDVAIVYGANLAAVLATQCLMWRRALHRLDGAPAVESTSTWRLVRTRYLLAFGVVVSAIGLAVADFAFAIYVYLALFGFAFRPETLRARA